MANFNFKVTEDDRPGGGVYKIPGNGPAWNIKQSDYPNLSLASLDASNFFVATSCNANPDYAWVRTSEYQNVGGDYYGGNKGTIAVSKNSSGLSVSVVGATNRGARCYKRIDGSGERTQYGSFSHTLYMSRTPIVQERFMAYKYIEPKDKVYAKAYKVYSGGIPATIDIKSKYPTIDYTKLTSQDFIASYKSDSSQTKSERQTAGKADDYWLWVNAMTVVCSYNPSNGILSVSPSTNNAFDYYLPGSRSSNSWSGLTGEVIMIVDGIKSEYT